MSINRIIKNTMLIYFIFVVLIQDIVSYPVIEAIDMYPAIEDIGSYPAIEDIGSCPAIEDIGSYPVIEVIGSCPTIEESIMSTTTAMPLFTLMTIRLAPIMTWLKMVRLCLPEISFDAVVGETLHLCWTLLNRFTYISSSRPLHCRFRT